MESVTANLGILHMKNPAAYSGRLHGIQQSRNLHQAGPMLRGCSPP